MTVFEKSRTDPVYLKNLGPTPFIEKSRTDAVYDPVYDPVYGDLRYDRKNESSLGFGWIEAMDELNRQISRVEYSRVFPFGGSPLKTTSSVEVAAADRNDALPGVGVGVKVLSEETATYKQMPYTVGVGGVVRRPVQTQSVKTLRDLTGTIVSQTTTTQNLADFDDYGFVKESTVDALDGTRILTKNDYLHNVTQWYLGRLDNSTVVKTRSGKAEINKKSQFSYDTHGLLASETIEPDGDASQKSIKSYERDGFGNITSTSLTGSGITRSSSSHYDSKGRFLLAESNQLNHTVSYNYDADRALLLSTTDIARKVTSFGYDHFGTLTRTYHPGSTVTGEATGYSNGSTLPPRVKDEVANPIVFFRAKQASGTPTTKVYLDSFGREVVTESLVLRTFASSQNSTYSKVYTVTQYDAHGRKCKITEPFTVDVTPASMYINYDILGRVLRTVHPDKAEDQTLEFNTKFLDIDTLAPTTQPTSYSKVQNSGSGILERWEDQHGRLIQSRDASQQITKFKYDLEGRTLEVSVGGVVLLSNVFDKLGNKTNVWEKNSGSSSSIYNALGEVTQTTNAKLQSTVYIPDPNGRPWKVIKPEGTYETFYDSPDASAIGMPWKTIGPDGYQETISFDSLGRPRSTSKTQRTPGQGIETFTTATTYDALGRVFTATDAGGLMVVHEYDLNYSFPVRLSIGPGSAGANKLLWQAGEYDSKGRPTSQTLAQGVTTKGTYKLSTNHLESLLTEIGTTILQNKTYGWDTLGNLGSRTDALSGRTETFAYDSLNRVTSATVSGSGGPPVANFTYNSNGNLTSKPGASLVYPTGTDPTRPHGVTSATIKGAARTYVYDAAGYVTSDSKRTYTWTSFGQLSSLDYPSAPALQSFAGIQIYAPSQVQTNFQFDAGGNRASQLKQRIAADGSRIMEETLYLGGYEREAHSTRTSGSSPPVTTRTVHRHSIGGFAVYTRTATPGLATVTKLTTILKDHLGSTDVLYTGTWNGSDFTNPQTEKQSFDPWGERRDPATLVAYRATDADPFRTSAQDYDRGYTGHEQLDDSGLIHMNGRIYDPELGRMLSPDPYVQVPEYSQNFNRYSYVMNNPLNLTDPTGFSWLGDAFSSIGGWLRENWRTVVVIVVVVVLTYFTAGAASAWGASLYASATGVAATSAAATMAGGAIAGGYIGAVAGGLGAAVNGGNLGDVLRGALIGGIQGAITGGVLHGWGEAAQSAGFFSAETALHVAGHGVVGGAANVAMGGKFGDGFLSAAVSAAAGDAGLFGAPSGDMAGMARRTIMAGVVGGTASALGGGKFANGAYTAAFQHLLNYEVSRVYDGFVPLDPEGCHQDAKFSYDFKNDTSSYTSWVPEDAGIHDFSGEAFELYSLTGAIRGIVGSITGSFTRQGFAITSKSVLTDLSNNSLKHTAKHLAEFQAHDPNLTANALREAAATLVQPKNLISIPGASRLTYDGLLNVGASRLPVRVVLNSLNKLRSVHIRN